MLAANVITKLEGIIWRFGWQTHNIWCGLDNVKLTVHQFSNRVREYGYSMLNESHASI